MDPPRTAFCQVQAGSDGSTEPEQRSETTQDMVSTPAFSGPPRWLMYPRSTASSLKNMAFSFPHQKLPLSNSLLFIHSSQKGGILLFKHLFQPVLGVLIGYNLSRSHKEHLLWILAPFPLLSSETSLCLLSTPFSAPSFSSSQKPPM